jgi:hypothetical protein
MTRCPATLVGYVFEYHCELPAEHEGPHLHTYPASYQATRPCTAGGVSGYIPLSPASAADACGMSPTHRSPTDDR